jgi:hypothetical protein
VPGGAVVETQGGRIELAQLLESIAPALVTKPLNRQAGLEVEARAGFDSSCQTVDALIEKRIEDRPGTRFAKVVDGGDAAAIGREGHLVNGVPHAPRWADPPRRSRVGQVTLALPFLRDNGRASVTLGCPRDPV